MGICVLQWMEQKETLRCWAGQMRTHSTLIIRCGIDVKLRWRKGVDRRWLRQTWPRATQGQQLAQDITEFVAWTFPKQVSQQQQWRCKQAASIPRTTSQLQIARRVPGENDLIFLLLAILVPFVPCDAWCGVSAWLETAAKTHS